MNSNMIVTSSFLVKSVLPETIRENPRAPLSPELFMEKIYRQAKPQIIYAGIQPEFSQIEGPIYFNLQTEGYASLCYTLNQDEPVFVCTTGNVKSSQLAMDLRGVGFKDVYELEGNW